LEGVNVQRVKFNLQRLYAFNMQRFYFLFIHNMPLYWSLVFNVQRSFCF